MRESGKRGARGACRDDQGAGLKAAEADWQERTEKMQQSVCVCVCARARTRVRDAESDGLRETK